MLEKPIAGNPKVKRRKVIQNGILNTVIDQEVAEVDGNAMKNKNCKFTMAVYTDEVFCTAIHTEPTITYCNIL